MKALGITVSSAALQYGALQRSTAVSVVAGAPERLGPANGLTGAERTADTFKRVRQDLRLHAPDLVVLVATRKHNNWTYRQAADRAGLVTLVELACHEEGIAYQEWTTERIGKAIELPASDLGSLGLERIGAAARPKYWTQGRGEAFAAALAGLHELAVDTH